MYLLSVIFQLEMAYTCIGDAGEEQKYYWKDKICSISQQKKHSQPTDHVSFCMYVSRLQSREN